ncbi:hypothetical protein [Pseudoalteromonas sp. MelDa3]|uniref:hypothetical protein n=1 Tax=Pseudoalteromonas sp. MelDa3 TaxID=888435 RepID=UPI000CC7B33F|nr:hypothetical protein [Pseudoalteromonas sp. MelDa3]PLT23668.1 hypothetical protein CXF89_18985 [Pseudoalteromonas sp. MelDa3]
MSDLKKFFKSLASSTPALKNQSYIYKREIDKFLERHFLLSVVEVMALLKIDDLTVLKAIIGDNKLFTVSDIYSQGQLGFPSFQFDLTNGSVKPINIKILRLVSSSYENWDLAFWFNSFNNNLERSYIEAMNQPEIYEELISAVESDLTTDIF